jgi:HEAT repeat protein
MSRACRLLIAASLFAAPPVGAQSLADRITAAGDGPITFEFAARPEICGDGERSVRIGSRSYMGEMSSIQRPCVHGPVQVRLTLRGAGVDRVESWVGAPRPRDGRALGSVPAPEAARYLLALALRASGTPAAKAIAPAVFADSTVVWPGLLAIARDSSGQRRAARNDAAFWLSRFAAAAIAGHPASLDDDDDQSERDDVKVQAVFVLSQLPNREGIAPLLNVARSKAALPVRRSALFWLGQSGDPRALDLFESLLRS